MPVPPDQSTLIVNTLEDLYRTLEELRQQPGMHADALFGAVYDRVGWQVRDHAWKTLMKLVNATVRGKDPRKVKVF